MTEADLSDCLAQASRGDETATRSLIRYMYPFVYKLVRSNVSRQGEEEDLVQAVLIKVFKGLDQFSGRVPFLHWVSRIAVNTCLNRIRHEKSRPEVRMADLSKEEESVVQALAATEEELTANMSFAARDLARHLMECLRPKDRLLIRLVYFEGLSIEEAGASTGWSAGAIAMRISRAKARMKKRYENLVAEGKFP